MRALVVFHNNGIGLFHRFLKSGFKHCAVLINDGEYWVGFDNGPGVPIIEVVSDGDFDLASHYRKSYTVEEVDIERRPLPNGIGFHSCVTSIKRLLCIRAFWIQTPYQLYRHLRK